MNPARLRHLLPIALVAMLSSCPACDSDAGDGRDDASTLDLADDADTSTNPCDCPDGVCADGTCNVRVVLSDDCRGRIDQADVLIDGQSVGTASPDAPYISCQTYACDTSVTMEVRSTGFSTGQRTLSVALDPEVPLSCENL